MKHKHRCDKYLCHSREVNGLSGFWSMLLVQRPVWLVADQMELVDEEVFLWSTGVPFFCLLEKRVDGFPPGAIRRPRGI